MISRHNSLYWTLDEYLGLGASAHSMINKKRYYFPRDIHYFLNGNDMIFDCDACGFDEYVMLHLRLSTGIDFCDANKMGFTFSKEFLDKCRKYAENGYMQMNENFVKLTRKNT